LSSAGLHTACDTASAHQNNNAGSKGTTSDHPKLVLAATILASSLAFIDGSVVNVGLHSIGRSLHGGAADLQWVINAYLLPLSALLLLGGAAGDRFGRRSLLIIGIAVFACASAACAFAPSLPWLLAGRTAQGFGAAMLMPNSLAILGGAFSGEARGRAIGTWAAAGAITGAIGPVLGGWLIDSVGWRAIFFLNLPLAAGAIALAAVFVRDPPKADKPPPLDLLGALLATTGLAGLTWGLTLGAGRQGWSMEALVAVSLGALLIAAFLLVEKRRGDRAMMPLALFGSKSFVGLTLLTLLLYGALGGLLVMVPYMLIVAAHYSSTAAGAALLPFPLVLACTSPLMGGVAGRIGGRIPLTLGPLVVAAGFLLLLRIGPDGEYWTTVLPAVLVIALGMAGAVAPLTTTVLGSVDARHTGSASGLNSAVARGGGLVATALLGHVIASSGARLVTEFHVAAGIGAAAALGASLSGFALIAGETKAGKP
jgi:EmrB/QacA subfamily drug resistance transporter